MQAPHTQIDALLKLYNTHRYAEAETGVRALLEQFPDFAFAWKLLGGTLQMQGKEALFAFQKVVALMPQDAEAHFNLGVVFKSLGRLDEAVTHYRTALRLNPDYAEAHNSLGNALNELGQHEDAIACFRTAVKIKPHFAMAHNNIGNTLKKNGAFEDAIKSFKAAIESAPEFIDAHRNLCSVFHQLGKFKEAADSNRQLLLLTPNSADTYTNLGLALKGSSNLDAAMDSYRRALDIEPNNIRALGNLANAQKDIGKYNEALTIYLRILELDSECVDAMVGMCYLHIINGDASAAKQMIHRVLTVQPKNLEVRCLLTNFAKVKLGDKNLAALLATENSALPLSTGQEISLHFALGKCLNDIGDFEQAFPHFLKGCKLKRATYQYDPAQITREFDEIIKFFNPTIIERLQGVGNTSHTPIFIIGMPRSGTTLTEQIIASHPQVHGAGELFEMQRITQRTVYGLKGFPRNLRGLDQRTLSKWADDYVTMLRSYAPEATRITDKMPSNFRFVGLIHLILPNAKIIHINRNPVDTCLSCFTTLFQIQEQAFDLSELGRYYVDYARLMQHWRAVLPTDAFLNVQYEDIVADQEAQTRKIIGFCDLEWDNACLNFHKHERMVGTASMTQVRQPIYKSSVERWRAYEKHLDPLFDALGELSPKRH